MPLNATAGSVDIPDNTYPATLLNIVETPATANSPDKNPFLKWTFHVHYGPDGCEMSATSSMRFSPKAKARTWIESIRGQKFQTGEQFAFEAFGPHDCLVQVKKNEEGFCRIEAVFGLPNRAWQAPNQGPAQVAPPLTPPVMPASATPAGVAV